MLAAAINSKDPGMVVEVLRCTQDTCSGDEVTCDTKLIDGWLPNSHRVNSGKKSLASCFKEC